jgi:hypothetical protein
MSHTHFTTLRLHGKISNGVFSKTVKGSKHKLRKPPAWAVDIADLDEAERLGATLVEIYDIETHATYTATIEHIRDWGIYFDRCYGKTIALPLRYWHFIAPLETGIQGKPPC